MKISKAEKERRQEKKVYDGFDYWLDQLEDCYNSDRTLANFQVIFAGIEGYVTGCFHGGGIKWKKRLDKRFSDWLANHQGTIDGYCERGLKRVEFEKKCNSWLGK